MEWSIEKSSKVYILYYGQHFRIMRLVVEEHLGPQTSSVQLRADAYISERENCKTIFERLLAVG